MKILQISDLAPPHIGGIEKIVWRYGKLLREQGNYVTILTSKLPNTKRREILDGVEYRRIPKLMLLLPSINIDKFDIIHTHSYFSFYMLGLEKKLNKKIIIKHIHSIYGPQLEEFTGWSISKFLSLFENSLIKSECSSYIVPSEFTKNNLIKIGVREKIFVIPHAPEYNFFPKKEIAREVIGLPKNKNIVGFIGRMSKGKGPQDIAAVWKNIVKKFPNSLLVFVGPEPEIRSSGIKGINELVFQILKESDVLDSVIFTGKVEDEKIPYYISSFDIFVSPSINEGFGLSILNAMAAGVPVVAYNNSAIPEVVGDAGVLVETKNLNALENAIISLLDNKKFYEEISQRAKERASNYKWENFIKLLMDVYCNYL